MTIAELLKGLVIKRVRGPLGKEINGIAYDSRLIKDGYIFVAIKGFTVDGHTYVKDAIDRGAVGVVLEEKTDLSRTQKSHGRHSGIPHVVYHESVVRGLHNSTTFIEVDDSREALAFLSTAFYKEPAKKISLIGITGTNGKTTTSYITKSILDAWGKKVGLLGTINYIVGNRILTAPQTTPESLDLQGYLSEMVDSEVDYAVIEVSSHALALKKVEGCLFKLAMFTNFSQDHMDFHGTMEEYFAVKARLFNYLQKDGYAVLNWDDPKVRGLAEKLNCNLITCGFEKGAMLRAENIKEHGLRDGLSFEIQAPDGRFTVNSALVGRSNIYNILMSVATAYAFGIDREVIVEGIKKVQPIEGRFEKIDEGQDFTCIVDYAHTEDALRKLIEETRPLTKEKLITVFGCGGDRDRTKRPKMGAAATELSDFVFLTSDNPRTEEPMQIIEEIIKGIRKDHYAVQPDRTAAIKEAVSMARAGDTLLIVGKGHENYQEIKGVRRHFSDKEVLKEEIRKRII